MKPLGWGISNKAQIPTEFRYLRFTCTELIGASSAMQLSKIEFSTIDNVVLPFATPIEVKSYDADSSTRPTERSKNIWDNSVSTKWCVYNEGDYNGTERKPPSWSIADFGVNLISINAGKIKWRWYTANDSESQYARNPSDFSLEASVDGEKWWLLDDVKDYQPPKANYALAYEGIIRSIKPSKMGGGKLKCLIISCMRFVSRCVRHLWKEVV